MFKSSASLFDRPLSITKDASAWLDLFRGLAALVVLVGHWRAILFVDYAQVAHPAWWMAPFYFVTGLGHQAVVIFFVLSGFFIGNVVVDALREGRWSTVGYAVDRCSRLYVVLVPALLACWAWDSLGFALFGTAGIYGGETPNEHVVAFPVAARSSLTVFLGNLGFLQTIVVPPFGSNGPLWSLAYEFWYYAIFPMLFLAVFLQCGWKRWALVGMAVLMLMFVGEDIAAYFGIWLLGVATSLTARHFPSRPSDRQVVKVALAMMLLFGALALSRSRMLRGEFLSDMVVGVAFAVLIWVILGARMWLSWQRLARQLSSLSYTLYLVHLPPLVFWAASRGHVYKGQPTLINIGFALPGLGALLVWAFLFYQLSERHTHGVRKRVLRQLNIQPRKAAL